MIPTPGKQNFPTSTTSDTEAAAQPPEEDHTPHVSDPPQLTDLNTHFIANAGAGLLTAATTAIAADLTALSGGHSVLPLAIYLPFVVLAAGAAMAYFGRPLSVQNRPPDARSRASDPPTM